MENVYKTLIICGTILCCISTMASCEKRSKEEYNDTARVAVEVGCSQTLINNILIWECKEEL